MRDILSWDSQLAYLWDILNGEIQSKPSGSNFLNCHTSNSANRKRLKPTDSVWVIQNLIAKSQHTMKIRTHCVKIERVQIIEPTQRIRKVWILAGFWKCWTWKSNQNKSRESRSESTVAHIFRRSRGSRWVIRPATRQPTRQTTRRTSLERLENLARERFKHRTRMKTKITKKFARW